MTSCCIADLQSFDLQSASVSQLRAAPKSPRPAECNSAIQQIENLRYEEFFLRLSQLPSNIVLWLSYSGRLRFNARHEQEEREDRRIDRKLPGPGTGPALPRLFRVL